MNKVSKSVFDGISCEYKTIEQYTAKIPTNKIQDLILIVHINIVSLMKHFDNMYIYICIYGVTSWGNAALIYTYKLQDTLTRYKLNCIVKVITRTSFFQNKTSPSLYSTQPNEIERYCIYELEMVNFVYKFL